MARPGISGLAAALLYGTVSIAITFFNKAVLSVYHFGMPNLLTLIQMLFSLAFLVLAKRYRLIEYPDFDPALLKPMAPLAISFFLMVTTGLAALEFLNVPMFGALRRLTTLITMLSEMMLQGKPFVPRIALPIMVMVIGAIVAGATDLTFSFVGYFLVFLNCIFTATYLVFINRLSKQTGLSTFGLLFYNNIMCVPLVAVTVLATGELPEMVTFPHWARFDFLVCFVASSSMAILLNYTIFLCTAVTSALTTSVTGQVKTIVTTVVGLFIFGDVQITLSNVSGLSLGILGSIWYSAIKYQEQAQRTASSASKASEMMSPATTPKPIDHTGDGVLKQR
eukprot:CAMPEP_0196772410 /NCGR_PEP_ID=MMETSP1104-20130614/2216_1 /TAXON_ID=33652 /ORGANISM="Cafeteria sp., Strain Caron Lab Isolate" /LENGTH=336 /DNA_ID=CAMNT_0042142545 /DNA_START=1 /DNA_END=1011 /DNA_ORIENTATION=-